MKIFIFLPFIDLLVSMVFVLKVTTILETFVFANLDGVKKLAINAYLIGNVQIKVLGTIHLLRWQKNWTGGRVGPENGHFCCPISNGIPTFLALADKLDR